MWKGESLLSQIYYIADWEDEYCDLTLDKMVNETKPVGNRKILRSISTPEDIETLKAQLAALEEQDGRRSFVMSVETPTKNSFFHNIKTAFWGGGKKWKGMWI